MLRGHDKKWHIVVAFAIAKQTIPEVISNKDESEMLRVLIKNANLLVLHANFTCKRSERRRKQPKMPFGDSNLDWMFSNDVLCLSCPSRSHKNASDIASPFCVNWWCIDFNLYPLLPIHYTTTQHLISSIRISDFQFIRTELRYGLVPFYYAF